MKFGLFTSSFFFFVYCAALSFFSLREQKLPLPPSSISSTNSPLSSSMSESEVSLSPPSPPVSGYKMETRNRREKEMGRETENEHEKGREGFVPPLPSLSMVAPPNEKESLEDQKREMMELIEALDEDCPVCSSPSVFGRSVLFTRDQERGRERWKGDGEGGRRVLYHSSLANSCILAASPSLKVSLPSILLVICYL